MKKTIHDLERKQLRGQRVLVRVDYNVPLEDGRVTDDTRIRATLPTLRHLVGHGARVIVTSHLGRPKGEPSPEFSLQPAADRLSELIDAPVRFLDDVAGDAIALELRAQRAQSCRREDSRIERRAYLVRHAAREQALETLACARAAVRRLRDVLVVAEHHRADRLAAPLDHHVKTGHPAAQRAFHRRRAHRLQHMARRHLAGRARRTRRHRDARQIECDQRGLRF